MKVFITLYKALLLYATVLSICLFVCYLDWLYATDKVWTLAWLIVNILYIWLCKSTLSYRDFYKLSGIVLLDTILNKKKLNK